MRFLGIELKDKAPDVKTIWLFKEKLIEWKLSKKLFERFGKELAKQNLIGKEGTIIDATIVEAPIQHNNKEEYRKGGREKSIKLNYARKTAMQGGRRSIIVVIEPDYLCNNAL